MTWEEYINDAPAEAAEDINAGTAEETTPKRDSDDPMGYTKEVFSKIQASALDIIFKLTDTLKLMSVALEEGEFEMSRCAEQAVTDDLDEALLDFSNLSEQAREFIRNYSDYLIKQRINNP